MSRVSSVLCDCKKSRRRQLLSVEAAGALQVARCPVVPHDAPVQLLSSLHHVNRATNLRGDLGSVALRVAKTEQSVFAEKRVEGVEFLHLPAR